MKRPILLMLPFLLALADPARAAYAVLQKVQGKVTVKTSGTSRSYEAKAGDPLYFGDQVSTEKDALAQITFKSGAAILVKGNSDLTLQGNKDNTSLVFTLGEFLIGLKHKLSPNQSFKVRTPAAVAAVRGTLFWGLSDGATKDSTYACFESKIEIQAQGKTVLLEPGQKVKIPFGQAPGTVEPANVPLSYLNTFAVDGSIQDLDKLIPAAPEKKEEKKPEEPKAAPAEQPK